MSHESHNVVCKNPEMMHQLSMERKPNLTSRASSGALAWRSSPWHWLCRSAALSQGGEWLGIWDLLKCGNGGHGENGKRLENPTTHFSTRISRTNADTDGGSGDDDDDDDDGDDDGDCEGDDNEDEDEDEDGVVGWLGGRAVGWWWGGGWWVMESPANFLFFLPGCLVSSHCAFSTSGKPSCISRRHFLSPNRAPLFSDKNLSGSSGPSVLKQ